MGNYIKGAKVEDKFADSLARDEDYTYILP